ncbi:MAG TPA: ATP synthase F1 subunit gamma [Acidimicrobiales bacterium]|nr:ATP synthase F1 subunit gamma [Acidimicrobiales bacterium]
MAGGQERILRQRIRSVRSTRKITKAMELIAASQIPRSIARIAANRPYRLGMQRIILEAALGDPAGAKKLLTLPDKVERATVVVLTGDRGLSGPYNNASLRAGERLLTQLTNDGTRAQLITVGKKAGSYFRYRGIDVEAHFAGFVDRPTYSNAQEIASQLIGPFLAGETQQVLLVSTRYYSAGTQAVDVDQLLPLVVPELPVSDEPTTLQGYTEFEPEVEKLLTTLVPRALESEIFTALLEGAASFHTSQQRAMAAATDNADELGQTLTRVMNRARQDSITTEIMEIVGGAEALRSGK